MDKFFRKAEIVMNVIGFSFLAVLIAYTMALMISVGFNVFGV